MSEKADATSNIAAFDERSPAEFASGASCASILAVMNHEIRTPLNAIIGFSELIAGEVLGPGAVPRYREYARDIANSGKHLLEIVNTLFDLVSIEGGSHRLTCEAIDLSALIDETCRAMEPAARHAGVELDWPRASAPLPVLGDPSALGKILRHIIGNGIKFSLGSGTVSVQVCMQVSSMTIDVIDDGIGMAEDFVERSTKPFQQEESHLARRRGGAGLGLPVSKALIEQMDGSLTIFTRRGAGTRVTLQVPRCDRTTHRSIGTSP